MESKNKKVKRNHKKAIVAHGEEFKSVVEYEEKCTTYFFDRATVKDDREYNIYFGPAREDE